MATREELNERLIETLLSNKDAAWWLNTSAQLWDLFDARVTIAIAPEAAGNDIQNWLREVASIVTELEEITHGS